MKHIEIDFHFICEKFLHKDLVVKYISTEDQLADVFTKGLSTAKFVKFRDKLMLDPLSISLRGYIKDNG